MTEVEIEGGNLVVRVKGIHKLFALRSRLEVPLSHVQGVDVDPEASRPWTGFRVGTYVPGLITAGYFYRDGEWSFIDVRDPSRAVTVRLRDERLGRLIIEVEDPRGTAARIQGALR